MTLLELVNFARREGGASGAPLSTLAGTLSLDDVNYVAWVVKSWNDLQRIYSEAKFMRSEFSLALAVNQWQYQTAALDPGFTVDAKGGIRRFKLDSIRVTTDSVNFSDEQVLPFLDYDRFKLTYRFGNMRGTKVLRPTLFSVHPDRSLLFGPVPDGSAPVTVVGEYWRLPQTLVADTDVPNLPPDFHELIAWRALRLYGSFDAAGDVYARAETEMERMQSDLDLDQAEAVYCGDPLA